MQKYKNVGSFRNYLFCIIVLMLLVTAGCGSKSIPLPFECALADDIGKVRYRLEGANLFIFEWSLDKSVFDQYFSDGSLIIYVATEPLDNDYCPNCVVDFSRTDEIMLHNNVSWSKDRVIVTYSDELIKGYRYFYKLELVSEDDCVVFQSNIIRFEHSDVNS